METVVFNLCGLWFWLTRRRRLHAYRSAAETLQLAHAYLLRDFTSRASTRDRGALLPHHTEALSILMDHAELTFAAAERLDSLADCCRFVSEELRAITAPAASLEPTPQLTRVPAPARMPAFPAVRLRVPRIIVAVPRLSSFGSFFQAETSGSVWERGLPAQWRLRTNAASADTVEEQLPLKAA